MNLNLNLKQMKKIAKNLFLFVALAAFGLSVNAQTFNGKVNVKKKQYIYKTNCNEVFGSDESKTKTEYYGLAVTKRKKSGKKVSALKTPCKTLVIRSNPGSFKEGKYRITFTTKKNSGDLISGIVGTKKKVRYEFEYEKGSVRTKDGKWSENAKDLDAAVKEIVGYVAMKLKL